MNLLDILREDFFDFPLSNMDVKVNFRSFINKKFDEYISLLGKVDDEDINLIKIESSKFIEKIKRSIDEYYYGFPAKAYFEFKEGMDFVKEYIKTINNSNIFQERYYYYRARVNYKGDNFKFTKEDMFHIPFNLRSKIGNQRYSISGFPCLYLGATPYTCWEELNRPKENQFVISRLQLSDKIKLLNLGIMPYHLKDFLYRKGYSSIVDLINENRKLLIAYLISIPIILSCSIKVKDEDSIFREEYIIPQLLTQWIRDEKLFDGIRFFSTKTYTYSRKNYNLYQNVVIPTMTSSDIGYCIKLSKEVMITEPVCADEVLKSFNDKVVRYFKNEIDKNNCPFLEEYNDIDYEIIKERNNGRIEKNNNSEIHYSSSGFSVIEMFLYKKELKSIEIRN